MPNQAFRAVLVGLLIAAAAAATAAAQDGGRIDERGSRLLAEGAGDRVCLTLSDPRDRRPMRRCLLPARPETVRVSIHESCRFGTRMFGIAPAGTRQVNLGGISDGKGGTVTVKLRALRIPTRVHPGGGAAFVVRRSLAGGPLTLTAYDADRRVIAQRPLGPFAAPYCVRTQKAIPAPR